MAQTGVVVVARIAFGLGIDCPFVRLAVHIVRLPMTISNAWGLSPICSQGAYVSNGALGLIGMRFSA